MVCLGWAIGAIRAPGLYRRSYSLVSAVSTKLSDGSFLHRTCTEHVYDRGGIQGPAVVCRLLRCHDCVVKPVKAAPAVSPSKSAPAVAFIACDEYSDGARSRYPLVGLAEHSFISSLFCDLHIIYILEAYFRVIFDVVINIEG